MGNRSKNNWPISSTQGRIDIEDIPSSLCVSQVVDQSISLFKSAPALVKNQMHETVGIAKAYTWALLRKTVYRPVDRNELDALGMIAAIEEVRTSPSHMAMVLKKTFARNLDLFHQNEVHEWAFNNMPPGSYNIMMISGSSMGKDSVSFDAAFVDLHLASPIAASNKVLTTLQINMWQRNRLIRMGYGDVMKVYSGKYKHIKPKPFPDYALSLLRDAERQPKLNPPNDISVPLYKRLRIN